MLKEIDIQAGKHTYGQHLELNELIKSGKTEVEIFEETFNILHKHLPKPRKYKNYLDYYDRIMEGLLFWTQQEQLLLKYDPTAEQLEAGIMDMVNKVKEFGTVKALAKAYSKDPDEILNWNYGKVFGILCTDLEEYKYQQRFNKVIERKNKIK